MGVLRRLLLPEQRLQLVDEAFVPAFAGKLSIINISAKNYQNRLMRVKVIICYTSVVFLKTRCTTWSVDLDDITVYLFIYKQSVPRLYRFV